MIANNAKAFDLHFILSRAIFLKWELELMMNGMKIMCLLAENLELLDSISFLPYALVSCPRRAD